MLMHGKEMEDDILVDIGRWCEKQLSKNSSDTTDLKINASFVGIREPKNWPVNFIVPGINNMTGY